LKRILKKKWVLLAAALVLTLSIGGAAFAAANDSSTTTPAAAAGTTATTACTSRGHSATDTDNGTDQPWGKQRSDETLVTGDVAAKVQAAAVAKVGSDATVVRVETDADGNAKYEVHMVKSDGTCVTVFVDDSYNVVSVQEGGAGGHGRGDGTCKGDGDGDGMGARHGKSSDGSTDSSSSSASTSSTAASTTY
jgi:hypothetical protein